MFRLNSVRDTQVCYNLFLVWCLVLVRLPLSPWPMLVICLCLLSVCLSVCLGYLCLCVRSALLFVVLASKLNCFASKRELKKIRSLDLNACKIILSSWSAYGRVCVKFQLCALCQPNETCFSCCCCSVRWPSESSSSSSLFAIINNNKTKTKLTAVRNFDRQSRATHRFVVRLPSTFERLKSNSGGCRQGRSRRSYLHLLALAESQSELLRARVMRDLNAVGHGWLCGQNDLPQSSRTDTDTHREVVVVANSYPISMGEN